MAVTNAGKLDSLERSIREEAQFIREAKCIREELRQNVKGYILDLKSNKLRSVKV